MSKLVNILIITGITLIILGITIEMIDFYNDYQCSTTQDPEWFKKNNCMRYVR